MLHPIDLTLSLLPRLFDVYSALALGTWASPVAKGRVSFLQTQPHHHIKTPHCISNYNSAALGTGFDQMTTRSFAALLHISCIYDQGMRQSSAKHHAKHLDGLKRRIKQSSLIF